MVTKAPPAQLSPHFRDALPEALAGRLQAPLARPFSESYWPPDPALQRHQRDYILPGLALYRLLREDGAPQPAALEGIDRVFERLALRSRGCLQRLGRLPSIRSAAAPPTATSASPAPETPESVPHARSL